MIVDAIVVINTIQIGEFKKRYDDYDYLIPSSYLTATSTPSACETHEWK
jgi:hypothetical protein